MSLDDLSNLADALTFALLVTVSGLIAWTTIKATSRRPGLLRAPKVSMSVAAILAVALVGVAAWPAARETADPAARTDGGRMELGTTVAGAQPLLGPAPAQGVRARTLEGSTSTTDADVPSSSSVASGEPGSGSTIHPSADPDHDPQAAPSSLPDSGDASDGLPDAPPGHDDDTPPGHDDDDTPPGHDDDDTPPGHDDDES